MKLFSSTQISWNEPWFFLIRIREAWGRRRRLLLAIGISVVMFLAIYFFGAGPRGLPGTIGISLAAGFVLVALFDVGNIQREVTVKEDCIIVNSAVGRGWFETFKLDAIDGVRLTRPAEWGKAYGGMVIAAPGDDFLVAVPNKVSLKTLADMLHRLGVAVSLSGWEPSDSDTRVGIRNQIELDPAAARGEINIQPVEDHAGPLLSPGQLAIQVIIALGPLLLALIGAIVVGVVLFRNWTVMSVLDKSLYGGGALIAVVAAFIYLVKIGQFVAASYGIRVARNKLHTRPNAMFGGMEDDLVTVEIFDRQSWTATVLKASDYGFLRIDRQQARLLFEGNKFRWTLPTSALIACRIEESTVGSEANPNAEKRYYVVIEAAKNDETWEAGMVYTRTELGNDTPESRYKRAQLLFTQLAEVV
ncbi:MAG: hypothetical protein ACYTG0_12995 [Planctomycetota bacterium]|jgi:hypothetical protein